LGGVAAVGGSVEAANVLSPHLRQCLCTPYCSSRSHLQLSPVPQCERQVHSLGRNRSLYQPHTPCLRAQSSALLVFTAPLPQPSNCVRARRCCRDAAPVPLGRSGVLSSVWFILAAAYAFDLPCPPFPHPKAHIGPTCSQSH
jgi:hypothetical protein